VQQVQPKAAIKTVATPPSLRSAKPSGPLGAIMALSDEEKIALFS
jgi:hypothetical protein